MSAFIFDEVLHRYMLDGVVLPSVTQIMKPLYDFSHVDKDVLRRAGEFGTAVHKTIEFHLLDDLDEGSLDRNLLNPLLAFKAWQANYYDILDGSEVIEKIGYHPKLKYAGTPDIETEAMIIDIKTRKCNPLTDGIQLAAYDYMTGKGDRLRYVLELKQDASYVFTNVGNKHAWSKFRYLLDYHNATQQIQSWRNK